ncbi:efflux RND transporter periplasmic adaptor subunit [Wenzhouxiangella sp. XN201]|uniref:efflux RND transporter periplasmic adaptor subunit n=1 Tax=Wenzhouxiangella sp. XN201 TaxID=2710755 RepID=UPI0013C8C03A|nr:efflux RND transporter periplasmic adaptor subunit [Wenzhouxiangella sp. XN201]NEZ03180.1 efflux RND transporter periplasmic adaptor subunit [Wenzhouxiangella sp. XN201]
MKKKLRYVLPPALVAASIIVVVFLASNRPDPPERDPVETAMMVDTIAAETAGEHFTVEAQGTVQPRTQTTLVPEVSGKVNRIAENFVAGGFFRAGEVLVEIDPSDYQTAVKQAQADLAAARARLADEQSRSDQARRDWQRLHGDDREPSELVLRIPQLEQAKASVLAAEAALDGARRDLERTRISLPYDGMVRSRSVDIGQYVGVGTTLGVAFAVDEAEVRLSLPDRDLAFLDLPQPGREAGPRPTVRFFGDVSGQRGSWTGEIVRTEGVIEESTRLTYAVARIQDPYGLLGEERQVALPMGTYVRADIQGRSAAGLIELPRETLREGDRLFIADADNRLDVRHVDVVRSTAERVYLADSVEPGERVITTAIAAPIPGTRLNVRESPSVEPELRILPADESDIAATTEAEQP